MRGGFSYGMFPAQQVLFCRGKRGPALIVTADAKPGQPTEVRLDVQLDGRHSPCAHTDRMDDPWRILPELYPPASAQQIPSGGGGGGDSVSSTAMLITDLEVATIASLYQQQLEAAGWTRGAEGQDSALAWSRWTFQDDEGQDWRGLFLLVQMSDTPGRYIVQVHAEWTDATGGISGPVGRTFHARMG